MKTETYYRSDEPRTTYFVAMVMTRPGDAPGAHMLCTEAFTVSGKDPLTRDEVIGRFDRMQADHWKTNEWGPRSSWGRGATNVVMHIVYPSP